MKNVDAIYKPSEDNSGSWESYKSKVTNELKQFIPKDKYWASNIQIDYKLKDNNLLEINIGKHNFEFDDSLIFYDTTILL